MKALLGPSGVLRSRSEWLCFLLGSGVRFVVVLVLLLGSRPGLPRLSSYLVVSHELNTLPS
jgi:hypothetical protein